MSELSTPVPSGSDDASSVSSAEREVEPTPTASPAETGEAETTEPETTEPETKEPETTPAKPSRVSRRGRRSGNPVVWREMYTRFDSLGVAAVIAIFVLFVGLAAVAWYAGTIDTGNGLLDLGRRGVNLFEFTLMMMLGLVMLVTPLQAAGAIALERDRQTLMPMQISLLRPSQIALGKMQVAATFSMFLLLVSAPILAIAWTVGSVPVGRLLAGLALLLVTVVFTTAVTVFCSSLTRRTVSAAFLALVALGVIVLGPSIGFVAFHLADAARGDDPVRAPKVLLATNPMMALATAVGHPINESGPQTFDQFGDPFQAGNGPLSALKSSLIVEQDGVLGLGIDEGFAPVGATIPAQATIPVLPATTVIDDDSEVDTEEEGADEGDGEGDSIDVGAAPGTSVPGFGPGQAAQVPQRGIPGIPLWLEYVVFVAAISALAAWGTTRRLRTPAMTER